MKTEHLLIRSGNLLLWLTWRHATISGVVVRGSKLLRGADADEGKERCTDLEWAVSIHFAGWLKAAVGHWQFLAST